MKTKKLKLFKVFSCTLRLAPCTLLLLFLAVVINAEVIPADRRIDWSIAGVTGGIDGYIANHEYINSVTITGLSTADTVAAGLANRVTIQNAINAASTGTIINIPAGTYRVHVDNYIAVNKDHIILRGAGPENTRFELTSDANATFLIMASPNPYQTKSSTLVVGGINKGDTQITVLDSSDFSVGDYMYIGGWDISGGGGSSAVDQGQIVKITAISGNDISFNIPLYKSNYSMPAESELRAVRYHTMLEGVGIENMHMHARHLESYISYKARFTLCANSWIRNCWLTGTPQNAGTNHTVIPAIACYRQEIRDNLLINDREGADQGWHMGYGVIIGLQSTACLIENNVFDYMRHAMSIGTGSGGNVAAYNFCWTSISEGHYDVQADLDTHNVNLPYHFLWESNCANRVWNNGGDAGTSFRNRLVMSGIEYGGGVDGENIVGNEQTVKKSDFGNLPVIEDDPAIDVLIHGNYNFYSGGAHAQPNTVQWDSTIVATDGYVIPDSLYLSAKPSWFGDLAWPAFGGDIRRNNFLQGLDYINTNRIPAQVRYWSRRFPENVPTNIRLAVNNDDSVTLSWDSDSTIGTTSEGEKLSIDYVICRSIDGTNYSRVAETSSTEYTDTSPVSGETNYYYIRARNTVRVLTASAVSTSPGADYYWSGLGGESNPSEVVNTGAPSPPIEPEEDADDPDAPDQVTGELEIKSYPNPYEYSAGSPMTFEFSGISGVSVLKIYSIAGNLVKTIELAQGQTTIQWDGKDETGTVVASGLYIYVLTTAEGKIKKGKFAFIK